MEKKIKISTVVCLALIITIGLAIQTYIFTFEKDGMHCDEMWSFGLANSYYEPYVFMSADETVKHNTFTWTSGDVLKDYITVQNGDQFNYGSVWYNQSMDMHPPLYYAIMHTISSFFPDTYSAWFGFAINMVCYVVMLIFAYRLAKLMTNSDFFALAFCSYWAICDGVLNMMQFVRMYTMSTTIFMALLYFTLKLIKEKKVSINVLWIAITVFLGSLTHHFFLTAAGILIAFVSIYFLIRKKIKLMFINGFSALGAVGISALVFPAMITHIISDHPNDVLPPFWFSVKACFRFMCSELFGVRISPYKTMTIDYIIVALILLVAIFVPIGFLLRHNEWVKENVFTLPKRIVNFFKTHNKNSLYFAIICFCTAFSVAMVVAKVVSVMEMGVNTDRYLFVVFPAMAISIIYVVYELLTHLIRKHKWIPKTLFCLVLCVFVVMGFKFNRCNYLYPANEGDIEIGDVVDDANVILAIPRLWTLTCYTDSLMDVDNFLLCDFQSYGALTEEIENLPSDKPLYLIISTSVLVEDYEKPDSFTSETAGVALYGHDKNAIFDFFKSLKIAEKFEYVGTDHIFLENIEIYKLKD